MDSILQPSAPYQNFTIDHYLPIGVISLIFIVVLFLAKPYPVEKNYKLAFLLSLIPFCAVISRALFTVYEGTFSVKEELPLHLCRLIAMILPFVIYFRNEKWINTLYFLIIVGTLQAVITADLQYTAPHYSYFIYWIFHVSLVWIPVFMVIRLHVYPSQKDLVRAFVAGNIYMVATLIINFSIGSNYFYTNHKPPGGSLLDLFGPWPYYILVVECLAVVLFIVAYLPFHKKENRQTTF